MCVRERERPPMRMREVNRSAMHRMHAKAKASEGRAKKKARDAYLITSTLYVGCGRKSEKRGDTERRTTLTHVNYTIILET